MQIHTSVPSASIPELKPPSISACSNQSTAQPCLPLAQGAATNNQPTAGAETATSAPKTSFVIQGLQKYETNIDKCTTKQFEDTVSRLKGQLLKDLKKRRKDFRLMAIRLLVLGKDEASAKPMIVVFCHQDSSETVRKFFQQEFAQRICCPKQPGLVDLKVVVEGLPLRAKVTHEPPLITVALGRPHGHDRKYWTTRIRTEGYEEARYATMGGLIVVTDKDGNSSLYGLTAGHILDQGCVDDVSDSEEFDDRMEIDMIPSPHSSPPTTGKLSPEMRPERRHPLDTAYGKTKAPEEDLEWKGLGYISPASYSVRARDRDWALIDGAAKFGCQSYFLNDVIERFVLDETGAGFVRPLDGVEISFKPPYVGSIDRTPSFAILPFGEDFVRTYTVQLQGALQEIPLGSSGTWVLTESEGWPVDNRSDWPEEAALGDFDGAVERLVRVFGHVAADDAFGDVYMVPLVDILEDIKKELSARDVRLPESTSEIEMMLAFTGEDFERLDSFKPDAPSASDNSNESLANHDLYAATSAAIVQPNNSSRSSNCHPGHIHSSFGSGGGTGCVVYEVNDTDIKWPFRFRWVCCQCHGDNSWEEPGCSFCNNHWRC
ncbi:hypothetical protein CC86DRAFT_408947 [Ophiobolus disseminans]|uniref:Uncharacterized protein n=1 Tax=Ophiobolus disseminans TaxID=1469910 RepID=A0A6A6ZS76_9PLEO|nr:hypothetical protein CC86DRAFT_408947 [Ophiobolus disseminans]